MGGGYTGDTFEMMYSLFSEKMMSVYAFEPDKLNISAYKKRVENLGYKNKIQYFEEGLYDCGGELRFSKAKDQGKIDENGEDIVSVTSIDKTVKEIYGDLYIKLDVEGAELKALYGATETIRRYRPYMQICLYHKMTDLYEVPTFIKSICPDYDFYLREGVHTECLAIPNKIKNGE